MTTIQIDDLITGDERHEGGTDQALRVENGGVILAVACFLICKSVDTKVEEHGLLPALEKELRV